MAGERSFQVCKHLLLKQIPENCVHVVSEMPFESALRKTYKIGIESGEKWLMTLDADVLLRKDAVSNLFSRAEALPEHFFQIEGLVHDKLTGMYRKAGHRIYRTKYLDTALRHIPVNNSEIRPEYVTLQRMEAIGFRSMEINTVFGVHDYEQFYRDVYRKAFVHANKHQVWLPKLISRWKELACEDDDFRIALRGLYDGLLSLAKVKIDVREYGEAADNALRDMGLQEKSEFPAYSIDFKRIEAILEDAGERLYDQKEKPRSMEAKLQRLRGRYYRLGALRLAPYFLGSLLCDIGSWIKQMAENDKHV